VFSSFLPPNAYCHETFGESGRVERVESVPIRRLETLFSDCVARVASPKVYLELDTQGFDSRVIDGLGGRLEGVEALQSEASVRPLYEGMLGYREFIERLNQAGFELTGLFCISRDAGLRAIEFDCVMVRGATG
jgi:hypothetical protein